MPIPTVFPDLDSAGKYLDHREMLIIGVKVSFNSLSLCSACLQWPPPSPSPAFTKCFLVRALFIFPLTHCS